MKFIIGRTNMPGSAKITAEQIIADGYGEVYFLDDVPMHKVNTFLRHLLSRVKDKTYLVIVVGVDRDKIMAVAGIDDDSQVYQWSGK